MEDDRSDPERLASCDPGSDPEDPYADVDISKLPGWWRRAIEEFETHNLRAYRPPRFEDGALLHKVVDNFERDLGIEVSFGSVDSDFREAWEVAVDGEPVAEIGRRRSPDGYSVYEMESATFAEMLRDAVEDR
jgi:hypothetical protein